MSNSCIKKYDAVVAYHTNYHRKYKPHKLVVREKECIGRHVKMFSHSGWSADEDRCDLAAWLCWITAILLLQIIHLGGSAPWIQEEELLPHTILFQVEIILIRHGLGFFCHALVSKHLIKFDSQSKIVLHCWITCCWD